MYRTRIKICGIMNLNDAENAVALGADALGFVFYPASKRYLAPEAASLIVQALPPFMAKVALVADASLAEVNEVLKHFAPDVIQFHGNEPEMFCKQFGIPYIKAIRVKDNQVISQAFENYPSAAALLMDAYAPGTFGGTGQSFEWRWLAGKHPKPIILAGGLNPDNVASAIAQVRPFAVDVSSGVEITPGVKCPKKLLAFFQEVRMSD